MIRTVVPRAELTAGVDPGLARAGAARRASLLVVGLAVADRLARTLVRPTTELAAVSHRLANAELDARVEPAGPAELREVGGRFEPLWPSGSRVLLREEREQGGRPVAPAAHPADRAAPGGRVAAATRTTRPG